MSALPDQPPGSPPGQSRRAAPARFVRREDKRSWHIAESWISGDAITYCGRRMPNEPNAYGALLTSDGHGHEAEPLCRTCAKRGRRPQSQDA